MDDYGTQESQLIAYSTFDELIAPRLRELIRFLKTTLARITFWGGSVDAQNILPHKSPKRVKEDVKRNLAALMPGGGYVFASIHNIQADVPPANVMATWEALQEYGRY